MNLRGVALVSILSFAGGLGAQEADGHCLPNTALSGNPGAAKLCAMEYADGNPKLFIYWSQIGAENGDAVSQYNYAVILLNNPSDKTRAMFWLRQSAKKGFAPAKQILEDIRLNPNARIPIAPPPPRIGARRKD